MGLSWFIMVYHGLSGLSKKTIHLPVHHHFHWPELGRAG
jgi:hypothetical protein